LKKLVIDSNQIKKRGGKRPGSGRKPRAKKLSNYDAALKMLDDSICDALQVLIDSLKDGNQYTKIRAAELILKKTLPDKIEAQVDPAAMTAAHEKLLRRIKT
jgi:hypothetical protein